MSSGFRHTPRDLGSGMLTSSRHVKKHTKHGKNKGNNQNKHYKDEKHSLQGKSGKVSDDFL